MTEEFKRVPADAPDWTIPDETDPAGIRRRTVVLGAAWSVPVIAAAVAVPLAAASTTDLVLEFIDGPYQALACGPLPDITVRATRSGAAAPGEPIIVTLPAGLTWSDGTTAPRTMVSDANGDVVLTGVLAGNTNGNYALGATSGAATAASSAEVQGANSGVISQFGGNFLPALPDGVLVEDMQTNTTSGGIYTIVRGSDGNAYVSSLPNGSTTWTSWTKSTSPAAGSITNIAISHQGLTNVVATDTQVGLYGGAPLSTPLPGGATIQDVESYSTGSTAVAVVLGSDGRAYSNTYVNGAGAWSGWTPTALAGATNIAVGETGRGAVVSSGGRIAPVGGGSASPVLPNGATIEDVVTNVNASNGIYTSNVVGSDGRAYTASYNPANNTWTNWTASTSTLSGSVDHIALSQSTGGNLFLGSTNQVSLAGPGTTSPPLPNGATIVDMEGATGANGVPYVAVLGSDGRAYASDYVNGAWTPWRVSRVGQGDLEHISLSQAGGSILVAGNPLC